MEPLLVTEVTVPVVKNALKPLLLLIMVPLLVNVLEVSRMLNSPVSDSVTPELMTKEPVDQATFEPSQSVVYGETEVGQGAAITCVIEAPKANANKNILANLMG